ncbi:MAG: 2,3-diketo-5-methylthiopentyl-1-phosphate enolase [Candidatus Scalindua rubra]|uniref:2,3-diketo-5-methylthiopentyl-1-phosphate enolase n=1 Tax=Candidatus Scalindua rubra TaxID=1872076 RepID=A0A1E3XA85_9BACT|nr:MAG: 2,3-diketo-5-methylthiopentyl-1-phosphate enolase [Candidatus Scalindua rubra]
MDNMKYLKYENERFTVHYIITINDNRSIEEHASDITFEQTVEVPKDCIPEKHFEDGIIGIVENIQPYGEKTSFDLRYFEIELCGFSSLEKHAHEHVIIGIRGNEILIKGDSSLISLLMILRLFTEFTLSPKIDSSFPQVTQNDMGEGFRMTRPNAYVGQASAVILRSEETKNLLLERQYVITIYHTQKTLA